MDTAPDLSIRRLGPEDIASFEALVSLFRIAFEHPEASTSEAVPLEPWLMKPHSVCFAAFAGHAVVGGLTLFVLDSYYRPQPSVYVYDLAVHPDHRRKGIARALVQHVGQWARTQGAAELYVQAHREDEEALAFYRSLPGVQEADVIHFDLMEADSDREP